MADDAPPPPAGESGGRGRAVDSTVIAVAAAVGTFVVLGCLLATVLESAGFGAPGGRPRPAYLALLYLGVLAGAAGPAVVAAWRLPGARRSSVQVGVVLAAVGTALYAAAVLLID